MHSEQSISIREGQHDDARQAHGNPSEWQVSIQEGLHDDAPRAHGVHGITWQSHMAAYFIHTGRVA